MAPQVLDHFPAAAGQSQYAWNELLDGQVWKLAAGADFNGKAPTFLANARTQAAKRGGRVRTRHLRDEQPEAVVIQFVA